MSDDEGIPAILLDPDSGTIVRFLEAWYGAPRLGPQRPQRSEPTAASRAEGTLRQLLDPLFRRSR